MFPGFISMSVFKMAVYSNRKDFIGVLVTNEIGSERANQVFDEVFSLSVHPSFKIEQAVHAITKNEAKLPTVLIGITIEPNSMFLPEFFEKIWAIEYPKSKLDVLISCQSPNQRQEVEKLVQDWKSKNVFRSVNFEKEFKGRKAYSQSEVEFP